MLIMLIKGNGVRSGRRSDEGSFWRVMFVLVVVYVCCYIA